MLDTTFDVIFGGSRTPPSVCATKATLGKGRNPATEKEKVLGRVSDTKQI